MGSPQDNDAWNAKFATKYGTVVIALNYGKAPKNAFPGPVHVSEFAPECNCSEQQHSRTFK